MLGADVLLMLTDTAGVFTADPRRDEDASLIEEIVEVDAALEKVVGGAGTERGSGGMASKLAAAKIAAWSGVRAVIASARAAGRRHRRARGPPGRHVVRAARAAAAAPQAVDRVRAAVGRQDRGRRGRAARARERRQVVAARGCARDRGRLRRRRDRGDRRRRRRGVRQGRLPLHVAAAPGVPGPQHRRPPRTASPTRSSIATISSSCPEPRRRRSLRRGRAMRRCAKMCRAFRDGVARA